LTQKVYNVFPEKKMRSILNNQVDAECLVLRYPVKHFEELFLTVVLVS